MKIDINFFRIFSHRITNLIVKHSSIEIKLDIITVQVEKSCYKLTNFSSAIDRNRFQLSPQFNSSRSSYDESESIASASVWRREAGMFSNKVDLMETLISWVVCRTLILLLRYSIVGTTIILWNCVAYHVREARYDRHVYSRVSGVQFSDILLCKSAIRRLFFPSCSIIA